jgi:hypothetical protein
MTLLRRQLGELARRRETTRRRRARHRVPSVALAGYTNAGKSSLLNRLTGADAPVRDALFATLDPLVRRAVLPDATPYTLTDTVGFVRHLPHQLVDAFRSTLDEVAGADLVLHVVDASAADAMGQVTTVRGVLHEIGAAQLPELLALNKVDVAPRGWAEALLRAHPGAGAVSAHTGEGVDRLREELGRMLRRRARAGGPVPGGRTGPRARGPGARCGRTGTLTVRPSRPPGPDRAPDRAVRRARHRRGRTPAALSALAVRADRGGTVDVDDAAVAPGWRPGDTPVSPRCLSAPIGGTRHTPRAPRPGEPRPAQHARPVWTVHAPSTHCPRPARRHRTETWWTFDPLALSPTS